MSNPHDIIKALLHTEKATVYAPAGKYLFLVDSGANKIQIKGAVEHIYKVNVDKVNTFVSMGKLRRVRYQLGKTRDLKKAVVTLKQGQKIETA